MEEARSVEEQLSEELPTEDLIRYCYHGFNSDFNHGAVC